MNGNVKSLAHSQLFISDMRRQCNGHLIRKCKVDGVCVSERMLGESMWKRTSKVLGAELYTILSEIDTAEC